MSRIHPPEASRGTAADGPRTAAWLALLALSGASWALGGLRTSPALVGLALAATLLKAQIVIDHYMGLRRVRGRWCALLASWLLLVGALVAAPLLIH